MAEVGNKGRPLRGEKKRQYLSQARQLFAEFGYRTTSFEQIAEAVGVSRSVLVKSFRDKPAFLKAVGDEWMEGLFLEPPPEALPPSDVLASLQSFTERFLSSLRKDQKTARILLAGLADPIEGEESAILHALFQSVANRLLPVFQEGQRAGVIRRGIDARQAAADWLRFLLGAALLPFAKIQEREAPMQMVETLLHGVFKTDV